MKTKPETVFKDPQDESNRLFQNMFLQGVRLFKKVDYLAYLMMNMGSCLQNLEKGKLLDKNEDTYSGLRREQLWDYAAQYMKGKPYVGLEFGVAWGYSTAYWMKNGEDLVAWHGYDTFDGLPESWRHYEKGHFSNGGEPPDIDDDRLNWYKGLVQDTFTYSDEKFRVNGSNLFISLDLDLFDPTFYVLSQLASSFKKGDLIYFDEPHDADEGSLVHMLIKLNPSKLRILAQAPCQLIFELTDDGLLFPEYLAPDS